MSGRIGRGVCYLLVTLPLAYPLAFGALLAVMLWPFVFGPVMLVVLVLAGLGHLVGRGGPATRAWRGAVAVAAEPVSWLAPAVLLAWGEARAERAVTRRLAGVPVPSPYRGGPGGAPWQRRWWSARAGDPATWRDVAYLVLAPFLALLWLVPLVVTGLLAVLVTLPAWFWATPDTGFALGPWWVSADTLPEAALVAVVALALLVPLLPLTLRLARTRARVVRARLGPTPEALAAAQVAEQRERRETAVRLSDDDRSRIERDLHDGAQTRMAAVTMRLGQVRRKFATDPEAARAMVDQAYEESLNALADLRNIARGIRPPILADRGLAAAVDSLVGTLPVPVRVEDGEAGAERPPATVEAAAYFVVAESLTNIVKHARATEAVVRIAQAADLLTVEISDNGRGGADPDGGGLAGLRDRVRSVDGVLDVHSPPGGPTTIRAELPCASS